LRFEIVSYDRILSNFVLRALEHNFSDRVNRKCNPREII